MGFCFFSIQQNTYGQFLKRLKQEVKNRAETHVINDAGNVTDKAITTTPVFRIFYKCPLKALILLSSFLKMGVARPIFVNVSAKIKE